MKPGWETKTLGELCSIEMGATPPRASASYFDPDKATTNVWLSIADISASDGRTIASSREHLSALGAARVRIVKAGTLLVSFKLSIGKLAFAGCDLRTNEAIAALTIRNDRQLDQEYLYWALRHFDWDSAAEADQKVKGRTLNKDKLTRIPVSLPLDLAEQRRIVEVLDEAFAGLTTATANAEKTLANARELFRGYSADIFSRLETSTPTIEIRAVADVFDGPHATPKTVKDGPIFLSISALQDGEVVLSETRHVTPDDFKIWTRRIKPRAGDIVFSYETRLGQAALIPENLECCLGRRMGLVRPRDERVNSRFFIYQYLSPSYQKYLEGRTLKGATVDRLSIKDFPSFPIRLPPRTDQDDVVERLDRARQAVDLVSSMQRQKLALLAELKASLLHRAFSGELVDAAVSLTTTAANNDFTMPEAAANVIAFAHRRHEIAGSERTFGRVKAQKVLQLVETVGKIDLGREPIKDAAGPNDFQHMLRAQKWAETRKFFTFVPRHGGTGFDFRKLADYDAMLARAQMATKPISEALGRAIEPVVVMKSLEAELLATVQAAWNNLILDDAVVTDDAIVREARENWHAAKMNIPRHKFYDAIKQVRALGIVPDGTAKRVGGQELLL